MDRLAAFVHRLGHAPHVVLFFLQRHGTVHIFVSGRSFSVYFSGELASSCSSTSLLVIFIFNFIHQGLALAYAALPFAFIVSCISFLSFLFLMLLVLFDVDFAKQTSAVGVVAAADQLHIPAALFIRKSGTAPREWRSSSLVSFAISYICLCE